MAFVPLVNNTPSPYEEAHLVLAAVCGSVLKNPPPWAPGDGIPNSPAEAAPPRLPPPLVLLGPSDPNILLWKCNIRRSFRWKRIYFHHMYVKKKTQKEQDFKRLGCVICAVLQHNNNKNQ